MFKPFILALAVAGALAGPAGASPIAQGETRLFNFVGSSTDPLSDILSWVRENLKPNTDIPPTGAFTAEAFGGLNLTGTALGSFDFFHQGINAPDLFDGEFSLRITANFAGLDLGADDGSLRVGFYRTDRGSSPFGFVTSTVATDDRPVANPGTSPVPEPGSLVLVALAGVALGASRWRSWTTGTGTTIG